MKNGKKFIAELKLYSDYLKWDESKKRYETYNEAIDMILGTHQVKYGDKILPYLDEIRESLYRKEFLASQRNLQFRGEQIFKHNVKLYNCSSTYCYSPDVFNRGFYVLLCGSGLGISLKNKFVKQLPLINERDGEIISFTIEDSIEGWSEAIKVLISSFCEHPSLYKEYFKHPIKFDYSQIRPKGAHIAGGFKAPGHAGLQSSIEKIERLLNKNQGEFKSIVAYDVFMHLSDAVLSGGVRRSAINVIIDQDDRDMVMAKTGSWYIDNPQRARSNNSVGLLRENFTKEEFQNLVELNNGDSDIGFVFMNHEDDMFNPCFEIGFNFYKQIKDRNEAVFQFCNLNELNASACVDNKGKFSESKFYQLCRNAAILGTLQAGYTEFKYLGDQTENIVKGEALLGISITGWMMRPELFNDEILIKGAAIVKETNKEIGKIIGINQAARTTTVKPSGNASVILETSSGIHPEHSKRYFRIMQLNKESDTAKYLEVHMPDVLEESLWSATKSDYVVYIPIENKETGLYKEDMKGIKHLEIIKQVQNSWVKGGKTEELCYNKLTQHNVSNTVIIDKLNDIVDYLFDEQKFFTAVSFISDRGDKDYVQSPFTSVFNTAELVEKYGEGVIFASGLIVDGLHYFNNNLWNALEYVKHPEKKLADSNEQTLMKKNWIKRVKKFSKNYLKNDLEKTIYCLKDVHLYHKWQVVNRTFRLLDFNEILTRPSYNDIDKYGAISCNGGACEIV